jgi:peroxiredoxin Q/BCP
MAQLRQDYDQFVSRDTEIVIVGPEGPRQFQSYWKENTLPFIGLPDPTASVLKRYGQEINLFKLGRMPAQVVIDRQGIARFVHYGHSMSDIPADQDVLELIDSLNQESTQLEKNPV